MLNGRLISEAISAAISARSMKGGDWGRVLGWEVDEHGEEEQEEEQGSMLRVVVEEVVGW